MVKEFWVQLNINTEYNVRIDFTITPFEILFGIEPKNSHTCIINVAYLVVKFPVFPTDVSANFRKIFILNRKMLQNRNLCIQVYQKMGKHLLLICEMFHH